MAKAKTPNYLKPIVIIFIAALILMFIFMTVVRYQASQTINRRAEPISENLISYFPKQRALKPTLDDTSPVRGNTEAPVTIFEYSSFKCQYSAEIQSVLEKVLQDYPTQVKLVWKDLPLEDAFPGAQKLHQAARCAQAQNAFWPFQLAAWQINSTDEQTLIELAKQLKLNTKEFTQCLVDGRYDGIIAKDVQEADDLLISGTPHFYINDQELIGLVDYETFKKIIDNELKK